MWWQIAGQVRSRYLVDLAKRLRSAEVKRCPHVGTAQVGKAELESRDPVVKRNGRYSSDLFWVEARQQSIAGPLGIAIDEAANRIPRNRREAANSCLQLLPNRAAYPLGFGIVALPSKR